MKRLVTTLAFVVATSVSAVAQSFPLPSVGRINVLPTWTSTQHHRQTSLATISTTRPDFGVKTGPITRCPIR
jgi:hypothetical protein